MCIRDVNRTSDNKARKVQKVIRILLQQALMAASRCDLREEENSNFPSQKTRKYPPRMLLVSKRVSE